MYTIKVIAKYSLPTLVFLGGVTAVLFIGFIAKPHVAGATSGSFPITGYAWSENIGWIDLNCANTAGACSTSPFGLTIDSSGNITGYAWSENIGWISANSSDLTGCPQSPCTATITSGGAMNGWMKALNATGGWSGFISLSGTSPTYGVTETGGVFSGYAWSDNVVGWTDWHYASSTYGTCTPSYSCSGSQITYINSSCQATNYGSACVSPAFCSSGSSSCLYPTPSVTGALTISPKLVPLGKTTTVSWNIANVQSCTVKGTNTDSWSGLSGSNTSKAITGQTTYTLSCVPDDPSAPLFTQSVTLNLVPTYRER